MNTGEAVEGMPVAYRSYYGTIRRVETVRAHPAGMIDRVVVELSHRYRSRCTIGRGNHVVLERLSKPVFANPHIRFLVAVAEEQKGRGKA